MSDFKNAARTSQMYQICVQWFGYRVTLYSRKKFHLNTVVKVSCFNYLFVFKPSFVCMDFKAQAKFAPNFYLVYSLLYKIILYSVSIYFFFDVLSGGVEFPWGRKVPETNIN